MADQENLNPELTQLLAGVCQTIMNYFSSNPGSYHDLQIKLVPGSEGEASLTILRDKAFASYLTIHPLVTGRIAPYATLRLEQNERLNQNHYRFSAACIHEGNLYSYFMRINVPDLQKLIDAIKFFSPRTVDSRLGELNGSDIQKAVEGALGINQLTVARVIHVDRHYDPFAGASFSRASEGPTRKGYQRPTTPPGPRPTAVH